MIVPMKKVTVIVQSKDVDDTIHTLGRAGVLHIEHQTAPQGEKIKELEEKYSSALNALHDLPENHDGQQKICSHCEETLSEILSIFKEEELIIETIKHFEKEIQSWKDWGDFDPKLIDDLKTKNINIQLYKIPKKEIKYIPEGIVVEEIFRRGHILYCALISTDNISFPFEVAPPPKRSLKEMMSCENELKKRAAEIENILRDFRRYKNSLLEHIGKIKNLMDFYKVREGRGVFEQLSYITGYCPADNVNLLEQAAENNKWGFFTETPAGQDNVPTLIKNPKWISIIEPVFNMISIVPGYNEVDVSLWFLIFFSIFFGMLIGDAGYGFLFLIVNTFLHIKFGEKMRNKSIFYLTYVLSFCALVWGVLTGTYFGQSCLPQCVHPLIPSLREDAAVQKLCFLIGAIHLTIAHTWVFIRRFPALKAFSELGWIFILWSAFFLAKTLILDESFPAFAKIMFISGTVLVISCTNPSKNVFKTAGTGLGDLLLNIVNSFTDIVSYIRIFAVGVAGVAVADAFIEMAEPFGFGSVWSGLITAFILIFGHTLNILLGMMSVLVHGIRLNVLEFSGHLDMEFSGTKYNPYKTK